MLNFDANVKKTTARHPCDDASLTGDVEVWALKLLLPEGKVGMVVRHLAHARLAGVCAADQDAEHGHRVELPQLLQGHVTVLRGRRQAVKIFTCDWCATQVLQS